MMTKEKIINIIKQAISVETDYDLAYLQNDTSFEQVGLESVLMVSITNQLEKNFGSLPKTLFFEYNTIEELAEYLVGQVDGIDDVHQAVEEQDRSDSQDKTILNHTEFVTKEAIENGPIKQPQAIDSINDLTQSMSVYDNLADEPKKIEQDDDIAIIGIQGRFPMADTLDELWDNLVNGKDCITEIPDDLKEKHSLFNNLSRAKWGGFIAGIDEFDPLFFNLSNKEAEMMDPQERLFLQEVYHTLEDAGYPAKRLKDCKVGVYAGIMWNQYQLYGANSGNAESFGASVANRISYFFDFTGPSVSLDTMCSSSLTTVYLACRDLKNRDIDYAIAGGANVDVHPNKHMYLENMGFAAEDGRCRSFGEGGTGYVPGDGVGAVMLKRVSDAVKDGDKIYAVIKGIEINHSGKSTGYSAPNPKAQIELMEKTFANNDIEPSSVKYMEMHGTGTALGDPIEVRAASSFFSKYMENDENKACAIGSIKSNIGHLEAAAGLAQIAKVLLQFKHKKLVPSIHSTVLNPNIDFNNTPFYVQQELQDWADEYEYDDGLLKMKPKVATISSLGAGGSNAFMVLEEYIAPDNEYPEELLSEDGKYLFVFSGRTKESLIHLMSDVINFLEVEQKKLKDEVSVTAGEILTYIKEYIMKGKKIGDNLIDEMDSLADFDIEAVDVVELLSQKVSIRLDIKLFDENMSLQNLSESVCEWIKNEKQKNYGRFMNEFFKKLSYTLQIGKEHMNVRAAIIASNIDELIDELTNKIASKSELVNLSSKKLNIKMTSKEDIELLKSLLVRSRIEKIKALWLKGIDIPWEEMYEEDEITMISTPVYPFEKERCWIEQGESVVYEKTEEFNPVAVVKHYESVVSGEEVYRQLSQNLQSKTIVSLSSEENCSIVRFNLSDVSYDAIFAVIQEASWYQWNRRNQSNFHVEITNVKMIKELPQTGYLQLILDEKQATVQAYVLDKKLELSTSLSYNIENYSKSKFPERLFFDVSYDQVTDYELYEKRMSSETLIVYAQDSARIAQILQDEVLDNNVFTIDVDDENTNFVDIKISKNVQEVYFLAGLIQKKGLPETFEQFQKHQKNGILALFNMVELLKKLNKKIKLKVLTNNTGNIDDTHREIQPTSASLIGFARGIGKELSNFDVEIIDIELLDKSENDIVADFKIIATGIKNVNEYFLQDGKIFEQTLQPIVEQTITTNKPQFKKNGVYVLIGGNGTVGKILTEYLATAYNAHIIWLGRRKLNKEIKDEIQKIEKLQGKLQYYSSDISIESDTISTFEKIVKKSGKIDGIIHCALDFQVQRFSTLDEQKITNGIAAKVYGGYILTKIAEKFTPDIMLMFSSAESFTANVGWSVYSAACNFKDALSRYINSRGGTKSVTINWGFWELPEKEDNELFIRKGIYPIDKTLGMNALEHALATGKKQITVMHVSDEVLERMNVTKRRQVKEDELNVKEPTKNTTQPDFIAKKSVIEVDSVEQLKPVIDKQIKQIISNILKIKIEKIQSDMDLSMYGIDSIVVSDIHSKVEEFLQCTIPATLLLENETLNDVVEYLLENGYADQLKNSNQKVEETSVEVLDVNQKVEETSVEVLNVNQKIEETSIEVLNVITKDQVNQYLNAYGKAYYAGEFKKKDKTKVTLTEFFKKAEDQLVHFATPVNGKIMEGLVIGKGEPILMISPVALTAPIWRNQFSELSKENMIIVIHPPGYGLSEKVKHSNNAGVSEAIGSTLAMLKINKGVTIFASCFGSIVAAHLAVHYPDVISRMCFIGGFYDGSDLPPMDLSNIKLEEFQKMTEKISQSIGVDFDIVMNNIQKNDKKNIERIKGDKDLLLNSQCANSLISLRYLNEMKTLSTAEWLSKMEQPLLCVYGDLDSVIPPIRSEEIGKMVKNSSLVEIAGAGHYPYLTHPDEFNNVVRKFMNNEE